MAWPPAGEGQDQAYEHDQDECVVNQMIDSWREHQVVVELFTSQGCPMCPSANEFLASLAEREDVIAIAYGVDYWDMYGWEDEFAMQTFGARQQDYVAAGEAMRVFTPHFVINGSPEKLKFKASEILDFIDHQQPYETAILFEHREDTHFARITGEALDRPADVLMVTYEEGVQSRAVGGGANEGKILTHVNVARDIIDLGEWRGGESVFTLPSMPLAEGLNAAILVQHGRGGPIIGARALP